MLVLSRKLGQSFRVGNGVRITVLKIDNNAVRIGIEAPEDVTISWRWIGRASCRERVYSGV